MNEELMRNSEISSLQAKLSGMKIDLAFLKLQYALKAYNPDQPRVPAGHPGGGQWVGENLGKQKPVRDQTAFKPPHLIETYNMGPTTICTYQGWPEQNRFAITIPRGECPQFYIPGIGPSY